MYIKKRELEDTFTKIFQTNQSLLIDGMLVANYNLPVSNDNFKLFLRDFYTRPVILKDFSLDENTIQTNVICKINYNDSEIISKPFFNFSNKRLQDVQLIEKQLKNVNFTYKLSKTHLYFQVMSSHIETQFRFYYNASTDKYSCNGLSYKDFLNRYASSLSSRHPAILHGQPQSLAVAVPVVELPQPSGSSLASGSNVLATPKAGQHSRLYPDLEALNMTPHSRPSVHSHIARLKNHKVIQEIADDMQVSFSTDMLKKEMKKNPSLLSLCLHGIIPIVDNRVNEEDEDEEVFDNINIGNENVEETRE
jgi:hypothetical protein